MVTGVLVALGAMVAAGAGVGGWMLLEAARKDIRPMTLTLSRLPEAFDGCNVLLVTDIHRRVLPERELRALAGQVDYVFLGGDITEKEVPLSRVEQNVQLLRSLAPVYAVYGNHDYKTNIQELGGLLSKSGVQVLKDQNVILEKDGAKICLTGVDYVDVKKRRYPRLKAMPREMHDCCRIVLVHDPIWIKGYADLPADLILAGHTHGGQIVVPFLPRLLVDPFYLTYRSGLFERDQPQAKVKHAKLFISRGIGTRRVPLRFRCPAEMHLITLRSGR